MTKTIIRFAAIPLALSASAALAQPGTAPAASQPAPAPSCAAIRDEIGTLAGGMQASGEQLQASLNAQYAASRRNMAAQTAGALASGLVPVPFVGSAAGAAITQGAQRDLEAATRNTAALNQRRLAESTSVYERMQVLASQHEANCSAGQP